MLLRNLVLENFGAYHGTQTLDLRTTTKKPIVLIGGLNGCGKTTLLDAIQLVLYGARARCSGRGSRPYDSYLRESINRRVDPEEGARLCLEFSITVDAQERVYRISRRWSATEKTVREVVTVFVDDSYDRVISEGWTNHVEDLLPLEVASLFFFDGEKIESLADPERAASVIESAVSSLLGVSTVEQLRTDLLALQRRHKSAKEADQGALQRMNELEQRLAELTRDLEPLGDRKAAARTRVVAAERALAKAEKTFRKEGGDLYQQREQLESTRREVSNKLDASRNELRALAAGAMPMLLVLDQLMAVREQAFVESTSLAAQNMVDLLEDRDKWLLDLLTSAMPAKKLDKVAQQLHDDRHDRQAATNSPRYLNVPSTAFGQFEAIEPILLSERDQADRILRRARNQSHELDDLDRRLAGVPAESAITDHLQERQAAQNAVDLASVQHLVESEKYETHKSLIKSVEDQLDQEHKKWADVLTKHEEAHRIVSHSDRVRVTLAKFASALLERHISRLEVAMLDSFSKLMRKNRLVKDLRIDTDKFIITLIGDDDEPLEPARLSAGERQLLAVSLLWGLARVAGNWLPSVIDTPLGRLDSKHREHLVDRYFPHASHQVLLLSTDEEIDEQLHSRLKRSIAHTYTLVHDDNELTTTVVPGYWWTSDPAHVA